MRRLLISAPLLLAVALAPALATASRSFNVPKLLKSRVAKIKAHSSIAVRLPDRMTAEPSKLYGSGGKTSRGYDLTLGAIKNCNGANVCLIGEFIGERHGHSAGGTRVALHKRHSGHFNPTMCGASCSPPMVEWRQGSVLYTIYARTGARTDAGERSRLVRMANQAIDAGPR